MRTIWQSSVYSATIQRSRFIGWTSRLSDQNDLPALIAEARRRWPAATHYTWAYRILPGSERTSDDGEPHATAGLPMLHIIQKQDLVETLIIVTRYFGGTKLGRGGLSHAYQTVCQATLANSWLAEMVPAYRIRATLDYARYAEVEHRLRALGLAITAQFGSQVELGLDCPQSLWPQVASFLGAQATLLHAPEQGWTMLWPPPAPDA